MSSNVGVYEQVVGEGVRIQPTPKVDEALDAIYNYEQTFLAGGWGGSKTTSGVYAAFKSAFRWAPGVEGIVAAPTYGQLYTGFVTLWRKYIPADYYSMTLSGSTPRIECYTPKGTSVIHLVSGQHPERVESKNVGWGYVDEVQDATDLYERIIGRVRDARAGFLRTFATGLTTNGWMEEVLLQGKLGPCKWVPVKSTDNPTLPLAWFVQLKRRLNKRQYKIFVEGEFAAAEGSVYPLFYSSIHASGTIPLDPSLPLYIGQDFNLCPMASVLIQLVPNCLQHDAPKCFHIVGELIEEGTTEQHATKLIALCTQLKRNHRDPRQVLVIPDATGVAGQHARGDSDVGILLQAGFHIRGPALIALQKRLGHKVDGSGANPFVRDRDNAVLAALENGEGLRRLFCDRAAAPKTVAALAGLTFKGRAASQHDHPTAALGYVVVVLDPVRPPTPARSRLTIGGPKTPGRGAGRLAR